MLTNGPAYYNEFDPKAAEWLRQLIADGLITPGHVDDRSIADVQPSDLAGFRRVHFFAGIGMWDYALNLAGWGDDEIWTGSCPCQPFSSAGKRNGAADERHLWPEYMRLIRGCRPKFVIGEQVASADVLGSAGKRRDGAAGPVWFDGIHVDLASAHYACGALDLPAACVGSPNIRQRLWWGGYDRGLADAKRERRGLSDERGYGVPEAARCGKDCRLADPEGDGRQQRWSESSGRRTSGERAAGGLEHAEQPGLERHSGHGDQRDESGRDGAQPCGPAPAPGGTRPWSRFSLIHCTDGKLRRIPAESESVLQRVADGGSNGMDAGWPESLRVAQAAKGYPLAIKVPHRVALLKGYGNAIVPHVAEVFIRAFARSVKFLRT